MTEEETAAAEAADDAAASAGTSNSQEATPSPTGTNAGGADAGKGIEYKQLAVEDELTRLRNERKANKKPTPDPVEAPDNSGNSGSPENTTNTNEPARPKADEPTKIVPPVGDFYRSMASGFVAMADYIFPRWSKWANNAPDHTPYKADPEQKEFLINAYEKFFRWLKIQFTPLHEFLFANFIVYWWRILYGIFFIRMPLWYKTRKAKKPPTAQQMAAAEAMKKAAEKEAADKAAEAAAQGLHKCEYEHCDKMIEEGRKYCDKSHAAKQRELNKQKAEKK